MTKIVRIALENFKAIDSMQMTFEGHSAIITGGNNKGKTSFLRGIVDRIRFQRPEIMVRQGATEGSGELVLDSGEKFVWDFNDQGRDKLTLISQEGQKSNVTKTLGAEFFPPLFDIDKFLQSTPQDQVKQLQKIVGLDFTEIDERRDKAYKERYKLNEESERFRVKLSKMMKCDKVDSVDVELLNIKRREAKAKQETEREVLNKLYKLNKDKNDEVLAQWEADKYHIDSNHDIAIKAWEEAKAKIDKEIGEHNKQIAEQSIKLEACRKAFNVLTDNGYTGTEVSQWLGDFNRSIKPGKSPLDFYPARPVKPEYPTRPETPDPMPARDRLDAIEKGIETIDAEILAATETNQRATRYQEYVDYMKEVKAAEDAAADANLKLQAIDEEKKELIASASFPQGISINSEGITVDGFPLDRGQLSTSKLYTAALRIASMNLGEVKSLYFDASFLDKNSLREIYEWAVSKDLQLLIERPDYDGNDISYELIEG